MNKFISTHYLTQRQTIRGRKKSGIRKFQLTTSRRGRLVNGEQETLALSISTHYLTQRQTKITHYYPEKQLYFNSLPHAEVDAATDGRSSICTLFQLTTSRRGRRRSEKEVELREHFNSLPHAEVDQIIEDSANYQFISTHYLTQRQTIRSRCLIPSVRIFQLTTSRRGRPEAASSSIPTDSFQLTTSRRGRLYLRKDGIIMYLISTHYLTQRQTDVLLFPSQDLYISTHYLTQRQTAVPPFVIRFAGFQLTTSRRGRQSSWLYIFFIFSISTHYLTQRQTKHFERFHSSL